MNSEMKIRQQFITDCVERFKKSSPREYALICKSVVEQRKKKKNKFGTVGKDGQGVIRWSLRLPEGLFNMLDKTLDNPRFLEDDGEMLWFKKRFKQFRVAEKL